jgi:glyceraldehyde 3-phosphate dehydrogenase
MIENRPIRIGIMGFGRIGRQVYELAVRSDDIEVVAVADIGKPGILHYLLTAESPPGSRYALEGNFMLNSRFTTRMMQIDSPREIPWDLFDLDMVVDCTGRFRDRASMQAHLDNGAGRVLMRTLPLDEADRIVVPGVNAALIHRDDRILSAGSATTNALCLLLSAVEKHYAIECVSMTTIHCYTSDQSLQDYAGRDYRRSRSAAENIIPNTHEAERCMAAIMPAYSGKVMTATLNVPVHNGCMLDTNLVIGGKEPDVDEFNEVVRSSVKAFPGIMDVTDDPIVSTDILGSTLSLLFDTKGTEKAGKHIIKALGWYENLGHAARLLDVVRLYHDLDMKEAA